MVLTVILLRTPTFGKEEKEEMKKNLKKKKDEKMFAENSHSAAFSDCHPFI